MENFTPIQPTQPIPQVQPLPQPIQPTQPTETPVSMTAEQFYSFIETPEGQKLLQPKLDQFFSKGLETWKQKSMPDIIKAEADKVISQKFPEETIEQKQIRELTERLNKTEQENHLKDLKTIAVTELNSKGLPVDLANYIPYTDIDGLNSILSGIEQIWTNSVNNAIQTKFKTEGKTPTGNNNNNSNQTITKAELMKMPMKQMIQFKNENPELYTQIINS